MACSAAVTVALIHFTTCRLRLQVRSTDTYTLANKDSPFHEIDIGETAAELQMRVSVSLLTRVSTASCSNA